MLIVKQKLRKSLYLAILCTLSINVVGGDEIRSVSVTFEDGRYHLSSKSLFAVAQDDLYAVLIDYDLSTKFTSLIVESRNVEPGADGMPRFYTRMEGCILFWCKTFVRNGYLLLASKNLIVAITDPETSDFEFGRERWQLSEEDGGTLVIYDFEMEPRFWVPPIIGPYFIKQVLKDSGTRAINRIGDLARGEEPRF